MKQEAIDHADIMSLKFKELKLNCPVYFRRHGIDDVYFWKKLTKNVHAEWDRDSGLCRLTRIDNKKEMNILATTPVFDLGHLRNIIQFFKNK